MNKYIMINHGNGTSRNWEGYFALLREAGALVGGSALHQGLSITNGVLSEAISKTITGYIVIQAADLEKAKEIANRSPVHLSGGTVELFTLLKDDAV